MVPAKSGPQAVSDLMSGQIDVYFGNSSELLPHINSDRIRLLAVGTPQRLAAARICRPWRRLCRASSSRPGTVFSRRPAPRSGSSRRCAILSAFAKSPVVAERLTSLGIVPGGLTKDETDAMFHHDYAAFAAAIKAAGLASQ